MSVFNLELNSVVNNTKIKNLNLEEIKNIY